MKSNTIENLTIKQNIVTPAHKTQEETTTLSKYNLLLSQLFHRLVKVLFSFFLLYLTLIKTLTITKNLLSTSCSEKRLRYHDYHSPVFLKNWRFIFHVTSFLALQKSVDASMFPFEI